MNPLNITRCIEATQRIMTNAKGLQVQAKAMGNHVTQIVMTYTDQAGDNNHVTLYVEAHEITGQHRVECNDTARPHVFINELMMSSFFATISTLNIHAQV